MAKPKSWAPWFEGHKRRAAKRQAERSYHKHLEEMAARRLAVSGLLMKAARRREEHPWWKFWGGSE